MDDFDQLSIWDKVKRGLETPEAEAARKLAATQSKYGAQPVERLKADPAELARRQAEVENRYRLIEEERQRKASLGE